MFADVNLALRVEGAEVRMMRALPHGFSVDLSGGVARFVRKGSPLNKVIGVGIDVPLDVPALAEIERRFAAHDEPVRFELATLAQPEVGCTLTERGYRLMGFENVLARPLIDTAVADPAELMTDFDEWRSLTVEGFLAGDDSGIKGDAATRAAMDELFEDIREAPGYQRYVARIDGKAAGAASMRVDGDIAVLAGAATLPAFRRRGVQSRLLATRLRDAYRQGAKIAVMTSWVGTQSQANAMKQGFSLLYPRAVLVR